MKNALVVLSRGELETSVAQALGIEIEKAVKVLVKYGEEVVGYALEIKSDKLTVALHRFAGLVELGLKPEEVHSLYLVRADFADYVKEEKIKTSISLRQLARLAMRFADFKEATADDQFELVAEILGIFRWSSLVRAIDRIIQVADENGFTRLDDLLCSAEDFVTGETFGVSLFSDDDPADERG